MIKVNDKFFVSTKQKNKIRQFKAVVKGIYNDFILLKHIDSKVCNYTECFLISQLKNQEVKLKKLRKH